MKERKSGDLLDKHHVFGGTLLKMKRPLWTWKRLYRSAVIKLVETLIIMTVMLVMMLLCGLLCALCGRG